MSILPKPAVTRNYSLTLEHIAKVYDMAARFHVSQGLVVRRAIDLLYDALETNPDLFQNDQQAVEQSAQAA